MDAAAAPDAPFLLNLFDDVSLALRRVAHDDATPGHRTWIGTSGGDDDVVAALTVGPGGRPAASWRAASPTPSRRPAPATRSQ
jgi:hypothetical protein